MSGSTKNQVAFKLPERLITNVDMARVTRELKKLDDWLHQAQIRTPGQSVNPPKTSASLEELATLNGVSLLDESHRVQLINAMENFLVHAPKIHMSFAVEPSASFLQTTVAWLRANVNPMVMLEIGLQPTLAAGCTLRTTNKFFDMSLRHRFVDMRSKLAESIAAVQADEPAKPVELVAELVVEANNAKASTVPEPTTAEVPPATPDTTPSTPEPPTTEASKPAEVAS